jgi:hypothetical protein
VVQCVVVVVVVVVVVAMLFETESARQLLQSTTDLYRSDTQHTLQQGKPSSMT